MPEYTVTPYTPSEYARAAEIASVLRDAINAPGAELVKIIERDGTFYIIHKKREPTKTKTVQSRNR